MPTGIEHGTVTLIRDGESFEVTTLRRDIETDGRRAKVVFGRDFVRGCAAARLHHQCARHSIATAGFTIIAAALADLAARRIRFIGEAGSRIREDYLRILRFFRFHARYGAGAPDPDGLAACIAGRAGLEGLSRERVRAEVMKLLVAPGAAEVVVAMAGAGLLLPVIGGVPHLSRFAAIAGGEGETVYPAFRLAALAVSVREDAIGCASGCGCRTRSSTGSSGIAGALEGLSGRADPAGHRRRCVIWRSVSGRMRSPPRWCC